jgi:hypothetical protein
MARTIMLLESELGYSILKEYPKMMHLLMADKNEFEYTFILTDIFIVAFLYCTIYDRLLILYSRSLYQRRRDGHSSLQNTAPRQETPHQ